MSDSHATSFELFLHLPVELQVWVWACALSPPTPQQKRTLVVGLQGRYICDNGHDYEHEDALCIVKNLRLVSKQANAQYLNSPQLQRIVHPRLPSHHRIQFTSPGSRVARYIRWDTQQDTIYLCDAYIQQRIYTINGRRPPLRFFGGYVFSDCPPREDHPTWALDPSSRPAHVVVSLESYKSLTSRPGEVLRSNIFAGRLEPMLFLSYFGIHYDLADILQAPLTAYQGRDWSRLDVTLKKITVVLDELANEALRTGDMSYEDLKYRSLMTDSSVLVWQLVWPQALSQYRVILPEVEFMARRRDA